ncbi:hypothetical protein MTQ13_09410 [Streptomyces sp. XM4011]|uniref:hypothetical protein n=1 Tax=Streptomyces sp. XM4011 TaxID=2929780 RepID=UPI001FFB817B|nr:hypothetical protein [Streptomyces sp. XM4011]MCK1814489.1 hypothetical protein [Streptomyces sp. XM4011]
MADRTLWAWRNLGLTSSGAWVAGGGLLTGALLIAAWINEAAGPAVVITLSVATAVWCFFQAPVTCGAPVRNHDDGCHNNAYGLLLGCHVRQHRWQKLKMLILRRRPSPEHRTILARVAKPAGTSTTIRRPPRLYGLFHGKLHASTNETRETM